MSTLSIRKLPKEIEKVLMRDARMQGKTKTAIVIEALQQKYHLEPSSVRHQSLRKFFGEMTLKEYQDFVSATQPFGNIDIEMWK